uniref:Uncharacterized protein n=1 Tax=Rhizophora mucronata TaxID=61149 RepID=A0A2P2JVU9_RHIMU
MAFALSSTKTSYLMTAALQSLPSQSSHREAVGAFCFRDGLSLKVLSRRRHRRATSTLALAGRRNQNLAIVSSSSSSSLLLLLLLRTRKRRNLCLLRMLVIWMKMPLRHSLPRGKKTFRMAAHCLVRMVVII